MGLFDFFGKEKNTKIEILVDEEGKNYLIKIPLKFIKELPDGNGIFNNEEVVENTYSGKVKVYKRRVFNKIFYVVFGDGEFYYTLDFYDCNGELLDWAFVKDNNKFLSFIKTGEVVHDPKNQNKNNKLSLV